MRIVLISDWFAEKMGYAENCLPKALAAQGHDVHVITSDAQPYFHLPLYRETYESFLGPPIVPCGTRPLNGYTLHRLPHVKVGRLFWIKGLLKTLSDLRPDIVQTFDVFSGTTLGSAFMQKRLSFKLFLESHLHASVLPRNLDDRSIVWRLYKASIGKYVASRSELCYPISTDTADVVARFLGMGGPKLRICSLGVDTDLFRPPGRAGDLLTRASLREKLGFLTSDIVCIYTGRFARDKGPLCLAQAIDNLVANGEPYRGLFVGNGTSPEVEEIRKCKGCVVHPFVAPADLPPFYWAAEIAVWPRQESTSQLDAAACGLPLILSDRIHVGERIEGNGRLYEENSVQDLARQIRALADPALRNALGQHGTRKMESLFSWNRIAAQRILDYEESLK